MVVAPQIFRQMCSARWLMQYMHAVRVWSTLPAPL